MLWEGTFYIVRYRSWRKIATAERTKRPYIRRNVPRVRLHILVARPVAPNFIEHPIAPNFFSQKTLDSQNPQKLLSFDKKILPNWA